MTVASIQPAQSAIATPRVGGAVSNGGAPPVVAAHSAGTAAAPCEVCPNSDPALACQPCIDRADELASQGWSDSDIAADMGIDVDQAVLLVALAEAIRLLAALTVDEVPTEGLRALIRAAAGPGHEDFGDRPDPPHIERGHMSDRNLACLVEQLRAGPRRSPSDISKALGYKHASTLRRKVGAIITPADPRNPRLRPAHYKETIDVEEASQIVRALGLSPCQVDWL